MAKKIEKCSVIGIFSIVQVHIYMDEKKSFEYSFVT
jgi:hypothetical protein